MNLKFRLFARGFLILIVFYDTGYGKAATTATTQKRSGIVDVSDKKLNNLIESALEGLRTAIAAGDKHLGVAPLEPYLVEDNLLWYYDDGIGRTRIFCSSRGISFLYGLSSYTVEDVSASMSDLDAVIKLKFNRLQAMGKYKFGGHLFGGVVPLSGEGVYGAVASRVQSVLRLNMSLIDGVIGVDTTSAEINLDQFTVKAERFMGIPAAYTNQTLNEMLHRLYNERREAVNYEVNKVLEAWTRDVFEGMKVRRLVEMLEYLSRKRSETSTQPRTNFVQDKVTSSLM